MDRAHEGDKADPRAMLCPRGGNGMRGRQEDGGVMTGAGTRELENCPP